MSEPLTPHAAQVRLAQYGERTKTWSTATYDSGTEKALHEIALTLSAELDRVNGRLRAVLGACDAAEEQATRWEDPLPVPEWVATVRDAAKGERLESCPRNQVGDDSGRHFFKNSVFLADGRRCIYCGTKEAAS